MVQGEGRPQPPARERPETFDVQVADKVRQCFMEVLTAHPEVRSLACCVDWFGPLNAAQGVMHGVWIGESGVVGTADAVYGSIGQTLRMLETQSARAMELNQHLREQYAVLASEVISKHGEVKRLQEEVTALRSAGGLGEEAKEAKAGDP